MSLGLSFRTKTEPSQTRLRVALSRSLLAARVLSALVVLAAPARSEELEGGEPLPQESHLSDRAELDRVIDIYHSGQYEACVVELERRLASESEVRFTDVLVIEKGQLYLASCALLAGEQKRAREVLVIALERNPMMAPPDSLTFPPPVVTLFLEVRDQIQGLISAREQQEIRRQKEASRRSRELEAARRAREKKLIELASQETLVAPNRRIVAFLPFGAGQYQNGQSGLGDFFLVTELGLGVIAVSSGLILTNLYQSGLEQPPGEADNSRFEAAHAVLTVSTWALVGVTAIGILEANLSYKPFRVVGTRKRALPQLSGPSAFHFSPTATPLEGGAYFGAVGRF